MHILGPFSRFPLLETRNLSPAEASWEAYQSTARRLGLQRCVIVQPSVYASDNSCTLEAVRRAAAEAVAVVVVDADVTEQTLADLHAKGARAVRMQMIVAGGLAFDALESVAARIAPLGWHIELFVDTRDLPPLADRLRRLPVPVVFDHMGHWHPGDRTEEAGFRVLLDLVASGRAWSKLSDARTIPSAARARQLIAANPRQLVWGSDWPHLSWTGPPADDAALLDQLQEWAPDEPTRHAILVDNAHRLYFSDRIHPASTTQAAMLADNT